jgi:hypothetical protein
VINFKIISHQYSFLSAPPSVVGKSTQLIVPPHKFGDWSELVERFDMKVKLLNNNLQEYAAILSNQTRH